MAGLGGYRDKSRREAVKRQICIGSVCLNRNFLGVAGELWVGAEIAYLNGQLRSKNGELRSKGDQLLALVTQEAGDAKISAESAATASANAQKSAERADEESARAKHKADAIVAALRQPTLTDADEKAISDRVRPCSNPNVRVVVVANNLSSLEIPIWSALKNGGFDKAELQVTSRIWYGTHVSGPVKDGLTVSCIQSAIAKSKKLFTWGLLGVDPPGSPITVWIGDEPMGELPK
jgi:hypothetical protein